MKKNTALFILALATLFSSVFGYVELQVAKRYQSIAEKAEKLAIEMRTEAERQRALAEENMHMAQANAAEAMRQQQLVEAELKRLRGK